MFRFLFKRTAKATPPPSDNLKTPSANRVQDDAAALAEEKAAALARARDLAGNEHAAAEFVLACKFADARLEAANHIHSKTLLESVAKAMRETDRRVAKLAQQRLEAIRKKEAICHKAGVCVEQLQRLAETPVVLPNQLSEIDREWEALPDIPADLAQKFEQSRTALQQRLLDQTALQRALIALRNEVQQTACAMEEKASPEVSMEAAAAQLDALSMQFSEYRLSQEAPSLPKHLLTEIDAAFVRARQLLEQLAQRKAAIDAHDRAYSAWEAEPDAACDMDLVRRQLRSLPALHADDCHLFDQRLKALQARNPKPVSTASAEQVRIDMPACRQKLEALEQALEEGALQLASEHDKVLRAAETNVLKWNHDEAARLAKARAELNRLKGWAHWGGKVSREELIKTAEELPAKEVNPSELAKKIGTLRSQWKSMDVRSGASDKDSWARFDAACTAAYAPVAAHFSALAAERKANQEKAQALIDQLKELVSAEALSIESGTADWKKAASFRSRMMQAWREIGPVDRKARKELDKQFAIEMEALSKPLAMAQQDEMRKREDLVAQAMQLDPADRTSMSRLRELQQQWQQHAKSLPLERKHEQALWLRFRAACDEYIARRNAGQKQTEAQQAENFQLKAALCDRLEAEAKKAGDITESLLSDAAQQWNAIGPVPRAQEREADERFQKAISALRSKLKVQRQAVRRKELACLHEKFMLCVTAEQAVMRHVQQDVPMLEEQWRRCEPLSDACEQVLQARFHAALAAIRFDDGRYAATLDRNRAELERDLLRLEIGLGIESPPQLAGERLKLQVDALQASLKSGSRGTDDRAMLRKLCELPAATDSDSQARIERLLERFANGPEKELRESN